MVLWCPGVVSLLFTKAKRLCRSILHEWPVLHSAALRACACRCRCRARSQWRAPLRLTIARRRPIVSAVVCSSDLTCFGVCSVRHYVAMLYHHTRQSSMLLSAQREARRLQMLVCLWREQAFGSHQRRAQVITHRDSPLVNSSRWYHSTRHAKAECSPHGAVEDNPRGCPPPHRRQKNMSRE